MTFDTSSLRTPGTSRALRLKTLTREVHETVDNTISSAASFDTLEGYCRFLRIQLNIHRDVAALYVDPRLLAVFPDLATRCRLPRVEADLADLGIALPAATSPVFSMSDFPAPAFAAGWLYVVEGSNLGAALLRKDAARIGLSDDFGARHLAPAPEGTASHWRSFTQRLDSMSLTEEEEVLIEDGAKAAFAQVQRHIANALA